MDYGEARKYIEGVRRRGSVFGLESMENLRRALSYPDRELNVIHIAGTNGKGSVGAFIESVLRAAGIDVCRYVSPAVMEYREILTHNGEMMTRDEAARYISRVRAAADSLAAEGKPYPTAFELETAMAFLYCRDKNSGFAVLETGMGGRLDAVNVIEKPAVSVITPVSMDHTAFLGGTLEEIAREKAGIIKENGLVITAPQERAVSDVIEQVCRERNAVLIKAPAPENVRGTVFDLGGMRDVEISLKGAFQPVNAALAASVCARLGLAEDKIRSGLKSAVWRGRFETIRKNPLFIIDGAHNEAAAVMLEKTVKEEFPNRKINFIIGVLADKEYEKIAEHTAYLADKIYAVEPDNPRALKRDVLGAALRKFNKNTETADIDAAVKKCLADKESVTIAFGSLSYLKDVVKAVRDEKV